MADDFDSVLSGVKNDAASQQPASDPPETVPATELPVSPELKGVLGDVKEMANPSPRSDADIDKEISEHQTQQKEYEAYTESQKPSEISKVANAILPGNPFANLINPEGKAKEANDFFAQSITGRVTAAFGHNAAEALGQAVSMKSPVTEEDMDKYPINGEDKWQNAINQYVVRPAIETGGNVYTLMDSLLAAGSIPFSAAAGAITQGAEETGSEAIKKEAAFITQPEIMGVLGQVQGQHVNVGEAIRHLVNPEAIHDFITKPPLPAEVVRAVDNGILTSADPAIKQEAAQTTAAIAAAKYRAAANLVPDVTPPSINDLVKKAVPDIYSTVSAASNRQDLLRRGIENLKSEQRKIAESSVPHSEVDIQAEKDKLADASPRKAKIYQTRIDEMESENRAHIEDATSSETPAITALRDGIESLDLQKRDLAKKSSDARKEAESTPLTQDEHNIPDAEWGKLKEAGKIQTDENGKEFVRAGDYWAEKKNRAKAFEERQRPPAKEKASVVKEPPLAAGMTRMYHGAATEEQIKEARWFTSDRKYAEGYASKSSSDGKGVVHYVDIPTNHPLIDPFYPDQSIANGFHASIELPEDISKNARPLIAEELSEPVAPSGKSPEEQHAAIADDISSKAQTAGISKEQADVGAILQARGIYGFFGRMFGISAEEMYAKHGADIVSIDKNTATKGSYSPVTQIIKIMQGGDISTMMHEGAHHFLTLMDKFARMDDAPQALLAEMETIKKWLKLKGDENLSDPKTGRRAQEQFARGFEQYLREGKAPTRELSHVFAKMKQWFNEIYQAVKNIKYQNSRFKLTDEARVFFDRTLTEHPEPIIESAEHEPASAATHEAEAKNTLPEKAEAVADNIESDIIKTAQRHNPEIANAIKSADEASKFTETAGGTTEPSAEAGGETGRSNATKESGKVTAGGSGLEEEGSGRGAESAANEPRTAANGESAIRSKPVDKLFDKAGNIRLELLTNDEEARAALRTIANKTPLLDHDVVGDKEIAELAKSLGLKAKEINIEKLRQLAIEDNLPLAARVRAGREMMLEADKQVRELANKVENGTSADLQAFTEAHNRFLMISETVSAVTNQIGRALRAFQDISGDKKESASQLEALFQQEMLNSSYDMKDLAKLVATKTENESVAKMLQASIKPGFWDHFAEYRRCSILSGFVTHALWLTGTGVNLLYKPIVLDTLGGIHNQIGMALGREDTGSTVTGGVEGLSRAIIKALPNILSATGTAIRTGKTVLRPYEGELDTYLATGGIRKTMNINMDALKAATDSAFDVADYPELKAIQDKITEAVKENNADKVAGLQLTLDEQSDLKKKEVAQKIAAQMQSRLKSWGDLAGEIHDFGSSVMASALAVGKNIVAPGEFLKDKPLYEAKREEGAVPDIYIKGVNVAPIGSVMRGMSSRIYSSMHTFARETAANIETLQEARRFATKEGLKGEDLTNRVNDLLSNPTKELMKSVNHLANKQTLMSNESEWAKAATRIRNAIDFHTGTKIGSVLMPVVGVPAEAVRQTVAESSPFGLLDRTERDALMGKMGAAEQERAQVKMIAGTALIGLGIYMSQKGLSTPSPSINYTQEQERRDAGRQSGSIRIGDMMVSLNHVPVTGTLITLGADLNHIMQTYKEEDLSDKLKPAIASAINNFLLHENALVGLSDAVDAVRGKSDASSYLKNQAVSTIVPAFIKQGNDLLDPYLRESKSFKSSVLSRIPGESESLAPRINALTGEPLEREPLHINTAIPDLIAQQLMAVHMYPTNPHPNINGVDLSTHQSAEYSSIKGHILHNGLQMLMQGDGKPDFDEADVNGKRKMVQRIELHASQCAKSFMFNRYPDLLKDANDRYESACANEAY